MSSIPLAPGVLAGARSRRADFPVAVQFIDRWSPRAFTDETMTEADLLGVLEAARWAPSASNAQPWRFCYSLRGDAHWAGYLGVLNETNQRWARRAAALVVVLSSRYIVAPSGEASVSRTHAFDTGCAWGFLALQAHLSGWAAHAGWPPRPVSRRAPTTRCSTSAGAPFAHSPSRCASSCRTSTATRRWTTRGSCKERPLP